MSLRPGSLPGPHIMLERFVRIAVGSPCVFISIPEVSPQRLKALGLFSATVVVLQWLPENIRVPLCWHPLFITTPKGNHRDGGLQTAHPTLSFPAHQHPTLIIGVLDPTDLLTLRTCTAPCCHRPGTGK